MEKKEGRPNDLVKTPNTAFVSTRAVGNSIKRKNNQNLESRTMPKHL